MTNDEFKAQLARLHIVYNGTIETDEQYVADLLRLYWQLDLQEWTRVIDHVIEKHKGRKRPIVDDFVQALKQLRELRIPRSSPPDLSPEQRKQDLIAYARKMTPGQIRKAMSFQLTKQIPEVQAIWDETLARETPQQQEAP